MDQPQQQLKTHSGGSAKLGLIIHPSIIEDPLLGRFFKTILHQKVMSWNTQHKGKRT